MKRCITFALLLLPGLSVASNDYGQQFTAAIRECEAINAQEYQSGLFFNPDGHRSYIALEPVRTTVNGAMLL